MHPSFKIPFNHLDTHGKELDYIRQAIQLGHVSGDGTFTKRCSDILEKELGVRKALLTTSCTHALEMISILLNIGPGDEVIVPSFTFVSTVNAFVLRGAKPVFIDIREDTLNIDENHLKKLITKKTKAIIPVHYAGVACEMNVIMKVANEYGIPVIEDNAHGLFGKYDGKNLGTIGAMSTLSFHETKNFSCGEGGALLINDEKYVQRAEIIREKGTNRSKYFRGQVDKYSWVDIGSSYLISDILSAFMYGQLEERKKIQSNRKRIWNCYYENLYSWAEENKVRLPIVPELCDQAYHMFYMIMPSLEKRQELISFLKSKSILSVFHYVPLHLSDMGQKFGFEKGDLPNTEILSDRLLRLPFYTNLSENDQEAVVNAVREFKVDENQESVANVVNKELKIGKDNIF